ncbi:MAG: S24/S26 family peptidase [Clostridia bacterium]|nr:S24/S26 family peptidase [Clostridia bacterium]
MLTQDFKYRQVALKEAKDKKEVIDLMTTGSSMSPLLRSNTNIYIEFNHLDDIHNGDVIAFYDDYGVSVHRCIKKNNNRVLERGDNCNLWTKCKWIDTDNILGKMVCAEFKNTCLNMDTFRYRLYGCIMVYIGKLSNMVGRIRKKDSSQEKHATIDKEKTFSMLINKLIRIAYKMCIEYVEVADD